MNFNLMGVILFTAGATLIASAAYDKKPAELLKEILSGKKPEKKPTPDKGLLGKNPLGLPDSMIPDGKKNSQEIVNEKPDNWNPSWT